MNQDAAGGAGDPPWQAFPWLATMDSMQVARALQSHIDETGGRPVVAGTDIKVGQIAWEANLTG